MAKDSKPKDEPVEKPAKADVQGHASGGVDFVPSEKEYDPAKHANHSHPNP